MKTTTSRSPVPHHSRMTPGLRSDSLFNNPTATIALSMVLRELIRTMLNVNAIHLLGSSMVPRTQCPAYLWAPMSSADGDKAALNFVLRNGRAPGVNNATDKHSGLCCIFVNGGPCLSHAHATSQCPHQKRPHHVKATSVGSRGLGMLLGYGDVLLAFMSVVVIATVSLSNVISESGVGAVAVGNAGQQWP